MPQFPHVCMQPALTGCPEEDEEHLEVEVQRLDAVDASVIEAAIVWGVGGTV